MTPPPNFSIVDGPCGESDGTENMAIADTNGALSITIAMNPLEPTTQKSMNMIGVAYHSDGQTYGNYPDDIGYNSHVQVFTPIPAPSDGAWQPVESNALASR